MCDNAAYGWLATSMTNIGDALFTVPLGMISDRYGRLKTLYPCTAVMIVVAFASAFATEYWQFLLSRLLVGATTYGIYLPAFILCGEFVGPRYRPLSQTIIWFAFTGVLLVLVLKCHCNAKIVDLVLIATEQYFRTRLNGAFSFSISCLVSEIFRFLKHAN